MKRGYQNSKDLSKLFFSEYKGLDFVKIIYQQFINYLNTPNTFDLLPKRYSSPRTKIASEWVGSQARDKLSVMMACVGQSEFPCVSRALLGSPRASVYHRLCANSRKNRRVSHQQQEGRTNYVDGHRNGMAEQITNYADSRD